MCHRLGSFTSLAAGSGGGAAHLAQVPVSALHLHPDTDGRIRVHVTPRSATRITVTSAHRAVYSSFLSHVGTEYFMAVVSLISWSVVVELLLSIQSNVLRGRNCLTHLNQRRVRE